jgi:SAM-dependent methyltransferase
MMEKYFETNKSLWNGRTPFHEKSAFYDVESFKKGKSSLNFIELEELGDVSGKSLLHLQCHFGMDTISWARLGAQVTGVDFSAKAIDLARSLAAEVGENPRFMCSNVYDLKDILDGQFDIVFTSYGTITWLPDINRWAEIVSHFLKKGGVFYMVEFHPLLWILDDNFEKIQYSYFHTEKPFTDETQGSYADRNTDFKHTSYSWTHPLGTIINALVDLGLRIEFLHEFPFSVYNCFPNMIQGEDGWWRFKGLEDKIPLLFSLKASK